MDATLLNNPSELRKALGLVSGTKRKPGRPAKVKVPLPGTEELSTSPTSVTDTGPTVTLENLQSRSLSVSDTSLPSAPITVWEVTPIGYVESGSPRITDEQLDSLPADWRERLEQLALGRGEQAADTVAEIATYYSETGMADEDLTACIEFYLRNEII